MKKKKLKKKEKERRKNKDEKEVRYVNDFNSAHKIEDNSRGIKREFFNQQLFVSGKFRNL